MGVALLGAALMLPTRDVLGPLSAPVPMRDQSTLHHAGADARYLAIVFSALMNYSKL
jgi:hypothetical protein